MRGDSFSLEYVTLPHISEIFVYAMFFWPADVRSGADRYYIVAINIPSRNVFISFFVLLFVKRLDILSKI